MFKSLMPILFVEAIEPCLPFWEARLGFERLAEVPHGDVLGYAMLQRDGIVIAYQTFASLAADLVGLEHRAGGAIYLDVEDIDDVERRLAGADVIVPRRRTFYGATEIWVREPGGNTVGFAKHDA